MPPVAIAGAIIVGGMVAKGVADSNAARAQQAAAHDQLSFQMQERQDQMAAAEPSFGQMQAIQNQFSMSQQLINSQLGSLQNQLSLYNATTDQANKLMNGEDASTLAPLRREQALQSQQLKEQLMGQFGTGYAGTSAGSMALANMAMQQDFATSQAQQQSIGMYLGEAQGLGQGINQTYQTAGSLNAQGLASANQLQSLKVSAAGAPVNFNNTIATAGAGSAGLASAGGAATSIGGMMLGGAMGGGAGAAGSAGSAGLYAPTQGTNAGGSYMNAGAVA